MPDSAPDVPNEVAGGASPAAVATPPRALHRTLLGSLMSPAGRALIALALILIIGMIFNAEGAFFKLSTHRDALRQVSVFGILACGLTLVIISGGIDLAVGSVLALTAVALARLTIDSGWSAWGAVPLVLLLGAATGLASGAVSAWGRVQPFIATLAMMVFARGAAKWLTGGEKITPYVMEGGEFQDRTPALFHWIDTRLYDVLPSRLQSFAAWLGVEPRLQQPGGFNGFSLRTVLENVTIVTVIFAVVALVSWLLLSRHRFGRQLYAIGGNEKAAALSGIPVNWVKTFAYVLSGLFAGVAGICQAAQERQGDPNVGNAYELTAIAIVVIGGTNLMGGRGGIGLTILGTLTIGYLEKILSINAVGEPGRLMLTGLIIVVAVLAQRRRG